MSTFDQQEKRFTEAIRRLTDDECSKLIRIMEFITSATEEEAEILSLLMRQSTPLDELLAFIESKEVAA